MTIIRWLCCFSLLESWRGYEIAWWEGATVQKSLCHNDLLFCVGVGSEPSGVELWKNCFGLSVVQQMPRFMPFTVVDVKRTFIVQCVVLESCHTD